MKRFFLVVLVFMSALLISMAVMAQAETAPEVVWDKYMGGSYDYSYATSVSQTNDGGYVVVGSTNSTDGDVVGNHGGYDIWVVKLYGDGEVDWKKCLGGTGDDIARMIRQTSEGGYVIAGYTDSNDGNVSGNHGLDDYWVVKLDSVGNISWSMCYGGSDTDQAYGIAQTSDGGYIVAGSSSSMDGDLAPDQDGSWIVKLDSVGGIAWSQCLAATGMDSANSIRQTDDGGYIVAGTHVVVRLEDDGDVSWNRTLEGTIAKNSIQQTTDGGYVVAGSIYVPDFPSSIYFSYDFWVEKLDANGVMSWSNHYGGPGGGGEQLGHDVAYGIQQTDDGGYVVVGAKDENYQYSKIWVVKLNEIGTISWDKPFDRISSAHGVQQTNDGGYIVAGTKVNIVSSSFYIIKLAGITPVTAVTLDLESTSLFSGETTTLTATVSPADATDKTVTWTSDNETAATVDTDGVVTAHEPGVAVITATASDNVHYATCEVTVLTNYYSVTYDGNTSTGGSVPIDSGSPHMWGTDVTVLGKGSLSKFGFTFEGWNTKADGNGVSYSPMDIFEMPIADIVLYAQWSVSIYEINYVSGGNGTIAGLATQAVVHGGDTAEVTATPDTGYHFVIWSDGNYSSSRHETNVVESATYTAVFAINQTGPMVSLTAPASVEYSDMISLSAIVTVDGVPAPGKNVDFIVNGISVGKSQTDMNGKAVLSNIKITLKAGVYNTAANYKDKNRTYSAIQPITVKPENAAVQYSGSNTQRAGTVKLVAKVTQQNDGSNGSLALAKVNFDVKTSGGTLVGSYSAICDSSGNAVVNVKLYVAGVYTIDMKIVDDGYFIPATSTSMVTITPN